MQAHLQGQQAPTAQIASLWAARTTNYGTTPQSGGINIPPNKALVNFLDNHDVERFLYDAAGDMPALHNALTLLMTEDGIPCMYYGTEQNFDGGNDPANREVFWTANFDETGSTFQHFSELAKIRKAYTALRRGDLSVIYSTSHVAQEDDAGIFAYERKGGDPQNSAYALIVFNTNDFKSSTTADTNAMMTTAPPNTVLVDVLDPQQTQYTVAADATLRMQIPAQSASILIPQNQIQNL
jgi:glycosidase